MAGRCGAEPLPRVCFNYLASRHRFLGLKQVELQNVGFGEKILHWGVGKGVRGWPGARAGCTVSSLEGRHWCWHSRARLNVTSMVGVC